MNNKTHPLFFYLLFAFFFLGFLLFYPSHRTAPHSRIKSCYASSRILIAAVELYNMERPVAITALNSTTIPTLIRENYLKIMPVCPGGMVGEPPFYEGPVKKIGQTLQDFYVPVLPELLFKVGRKTLPPGTYILAVASGSINVSCTLHGAPPM